MYERFTARARKVMQLASQEVQQLKDKCIATQHILLGLLKEGSGVAAHVLKNLDLDLDKIRLEVGQITPPVADRAQLIPWFYRFFHLSFFSESRSPHTPTTMKVIAYAHEEARQLNHLYVGTEHILLGLIREEEGVAFQVLTNLGLNLQAVREEVFNLLGHNLPLPGLPKETNSSPDPSDPRIREIDEKIECLNRDMENAIMKQDFDRASTLHDRVIKLKRQQAKMLSKPPT